MGWFEHKHCWYPKTTPNKVMMPGSDLATKCLILEVCHCGAVRTIEYEPGQPPVVRLAVIKSEDKP